MAQLQDLLNKEVVNKLYDVHSDDKYYNDLNKALELDAKKLEHLHEDDYYSKGDQYNTDYKDENDI